MSTTVVTTDIEHSKESFTVHFNNVSGYPNIPGEFVESPRFGCWKLRLYLGGLHYRDFVALMLAYEGEESEVTVSLKFKVGENVCDDFKGRKTFKGNERVHGISQVKEKIHFMNEVFKYKYKDTVVIQVEVTTYGSIVQSNNKRSKHEQSMLADISKMLHSEQLSDVTIKVGNELIPAHKLILCMRSEVFAAMFKCDMIEASTNVIEISDFEVDVVMELLRYMYTDACNISVVNAEHLLSIAHKYNVIGLMILCEDYLSSTVNVDNVLYLVKVANKLSLYSLKKAAFQFIAKNSKAVMGQENFFASIDITVLQELTLYMGSLIK